MTMSRTASPTESGRSVPHLDLFAAVLSALCIIHCFALPVLISLLALSIPFTENEVVHVSLVLAALPATLWVIYKTYPAQPLFILAAATGLTLLLAGTFVAPLAAFEEPLTVVGALLLGSAHLWHWFDVRAARRTAGQPASQSESLQ